jgi:hypothetical protein
MPDMGIERFGRFGDGRFGRQRITTPSIKFSLSNQIVSNRFKPSSPPKFDIINI